MIVKRDIENQVENLSEILMQGRRARQISLEKAAQELRINKKYLLAFEQNDYQKLPVGLYGRNYLREYALYLKLDVAHVLALFDRGLEAANDKQYFFGHKVVKNTASLTFSKAIKSLIVFLVVFVCLVYLLFYLQNISAAPHLQIDSPKENIYTSENFIDVSGRAELDAEVRINDELVLVDREGKFSKRVSLSKGKNAIFFSAKKKHGKEIVITRYIVVDNNN